MLGLTPIYALMNLPVIQLVAQMSGYLNNVTLRRARAVSTN